MCTEKDDQRAPSDQRERTEATCERTRQIHARSTEMRRRAEVSRGQAAELRVQCDRVRRGEAMNDIPRPPQPEGQAERTCSVCGAAMPEGVGCSLCPGASVETAAAAFEEARERWDAAEATLVAAQATLTAAQAVHDQAEIDWEQDQTAWERAREAVRSPTGD